MPLLVEGKPIKYEIKVLTSLTENTEWQKEQLSLFRESVLENNNLLSSSLIILQGECASIDLNRFQCIGTPFATTCNILFLINQSQTKVCCAHLEEGVDKKQLISIFKLFNKMELEKENINLYLIGGYLDEKEKSIKVTDKLFSLICHDKKFKHYNLNLCLLLTAALNTDYKMICVENENENKEKENKKIAMPIYQNVAYNLASKRFISFTIKSQNIPYNTLRGAVMFSTSNKNGSMRIIYDCCNKKDILHGPKIESFKWECPDWANNVLSYNLSDDQILKFFSTSPQVEHQQFAKDSKDLFKFVASNNSKDVFNGNKPIYMKCGVILDKKNKMQHDVEEKKSDK